MKTKRIAAIFVVLFSIAPAAMAKPMKIGQITSKGGSECEQKTKYIASKTSLNSTTGQSNASGVK